ncbi:hypothetical protein VNO78_35018 [Psophocarpus tetragonolobus]|uniref:Uncharacterized protein n=1 Tax=Psophocarpus tetragonolobus TaxID=3891 RepID=A0AAN9NT90_PSOTE
MSEFPSNGGNEWQNSSYSFCVTEYATLDDVFGSEMGNPKNLSPLFSQNVYGNSTMNQTSPEFKPVINSVGKAEPYQPMLNYQSFLHSAEPYQPLLSETNFPSFYDDVIQDHQEPLMPTMHLNPQHDHLPPHKGGSAAPGGRKKRVTWTVEEQRLFLIGLARLFPVSDKKVKDIFVNLFDHLSHFGQKSIAFFLGLETRKHHSQ